MRVSAPLKVSLGFLLLFCISGAATTVVPMSIERMTEVSSHVVEGVPLQTWSQWNPQHTQIWTYTKFQVQRVLKGPSGPLVVVKQLGGRVGTTIQKVAGVRHLLPSERTVLFLHPSDENDGTLVVTGLMQGNFSVRTAENGTDVVTNGIAEVSAYSLTTAQLSPYRGAKLRLEELETRVRKAARE